MYNKYLPNLFSTAKIPRKISVASSIPSEDPNHYQEVILANHTNETDITALCVEILKTTTVPVFSAMSSLSLPIYIIVTHQRFGSGEPLSLEQKILEPLIPYVALFMVRNWLLRNSIGHRISGKTDADIEPYDDTFEDDSWHVLIALFANISSFTDAGLVAFAVLKNKPAGMQWAGSTILGSLNYIAELSTEVVDAFRRHAENRKQHGYNIKPFFKQKYINDLFNRHGENLARFLCEILPPVKGIIRAQVAATTLASYSSSPESRAMTIMKLPLVLSVYWATAYLTRFDLIQLGDNWKAAGKIIDIDNTLSRSSSLPLKLVGKTISGQIVLDCFKRIKCTPRSGLNILLAFSALGLMTLLIKALHEYVSSNDADAVYADKQGILVTYCAGKKRAMNIAPGFEVGILCVAVSLGIIGTFAKSATLHKQVRLSEAAIHSEDLETETIKANNCIFT